MTISFPVRTRKEKETRKSKKRLSKRRVMNMRKRRKRRGKRGKYQSQTTKKTNYPHPLKSNPQPFPCQSRARLQALRRPKGP